MKAAWLFLTLGTSTAVLIWLWIINPALFAVVLALCGIWVFAEILDAHWGHDDHLPIRARDDDWPAAEAEFVYDQELDLGGAL